ncbi:MAG: patatin-like phospholipase family protein [Rhodopila sp.]
MDQSLSTNGAAGRRAPIGARRIAPTVAAPGAWQVLVLAGGIALGAFEAGAFAALQEASGAAPDWIAAASIGAVNAAIIAGNPPNERVAALRRFWDFAATDPTPVISAMLGRPPLGGAWRRAYNDAAVLQALMFGRPGVFRPQPMLGLGTAPAPYDLTPLIDRLAEWVDFDRLNAAGPRLTIVATDVISGERVTFDTAHGTRIGPEHVAASGALLPLFAPVAIDGRLFADGGLASNTPLDLVMDEPGEGARQCFVIELFARSGSRPRFLTESITRAADLAFSNQTLRLLEARTREHRLLALLNRLAERLPPDLNADAEISEMLGQVRERSRETTVVSIVYRPGPDEAAPGKLFDFSCATLAERWAAGEHGMRDAVQRLARPDRATMLAPGLLLHELEAGPGQAI